MSWEESDDLELNEGMIIFITYFKTRLKHTFGVNVQWESGHEADRRRDDNLSVTWFPARSLSVYTRLKHAAVTSTKTSTRCRDQHQNQQHLALVLVLVSAGCSCRADRSAHSSANIYRISGEDEETRNDCRWTEAESSEQTSWAQNQNSAVTTRLLLRLKAVCEALTCDHVTAAPCFSLSALRPVQTLM